MESPCILRPTEYEVGGFTLERCTDIAYSAIDESTFFNLTGNGGAITLIYVKYVTRWNKLTAALRFLRNYAGPSSK